MLFSSLKFTQDYYPERGSFIDLNAKRRSLQLPVVEMR